MMNTFDYLRISVTDRCNLRCKYCEVNPAHKLSPDAVLSFEEIAHIVRITAQLGVKTVRITGGEPLVRKSICGLFKMISAIDGINDITFTTNAVNLDRHADELYAAGVRRFNFSLDSLNRDKYYKLTGGDQLEKVIDNIKQCSKTGFSPIKMNVVALRGINDDEIFDFIGFAAENKLILRFIELMDISANAKNFFEKHFLSIDEIKKIIAQRYELNPRREADLSTKGSGPAVYNQLEPGVDIGFISPVTSHFCASCNRLRLTANGILKPCLLRPGETNIMELIRNGVSDGELKKIIKTIFDNKEKACGKFSENNIMFANMSQIGG
jgi:cyclic pyranopterin phosphate synthase